ncbi:hypothetical protein Trydic_g14466 [Trypoxylus dichotomus]
MNEYTAHFDKHKINKQLKGFVSPPGLPIFGHLFAFSSELGFISNMLNTCKRYGKRVKLELFYEMPLLLVTDKDLVFHILTTKQMVAKDTFYDIIKEWVGDGLVTSAPSKWKKTRKALNPAFNVQILERHVKFFDKHVNVLIKRLKNEIDRDGFDLLPYINLCTLDIISETVMGVALNSQQGEHTQYIEDVDEIAKIVIRRLFSIVKRFPLTYRLTKDYKRDQEVIRRSRELPQKIIEERRTIQSSSGANGIPNGDDSREDKDLSLLDTLLEIKIDGRPLTDAEILSETQTFLFAGQDTSATTTSMCLYCLSKHAEVQDEVVKELEAIFGNSSRSPTYEDLHEIHYLEMVIKETLRLYTTVPFITRYIDEDISFDDVFIPKGMSVFVFLYGIHMNSDYYPDPEKFDPSRFAKEIMSNSFVPFASAPRNCIGQRFAMLEIKYLVAQILRNYKIVEVIDHTPQITAAAVLRFHNGVMVKLEHVIPKLLDILRKYGPRIKLDLCYGAPILIVTDKDVMSHILTTKSMLIKDSVYNLSEKWLGDGLATCKPEKWKLTRRIVNPAFNIQALENCVESFGKSSTALISKLNSEVNNDGVDVLPYIRLCTLGIVRETLMGIKQNPQEDKDSQYITDLDDVSTLAHRRQFSLLKVNPWLYRLSKDYKKEEEATKRMRNFAQRIIDSRKAIRAKLTGNWILANGADRKIRNTVLLDTILDAHINGRPITNREVLDEMQTFLFAGLDTSATCINLCLYCLSKHPEIQDTVVAELESIFGSDNRYPTANDLHEMYYMEMVIKETMRRYSPIPLIGRFLDEDISFGDVFIPKGLSVVLFLYGIHMNPDYYPNPEKFDPSRFEREAATYSFVPFGAGPRNCIGQRFGMLEIKYLLAEILRRFRICEVHGHVPQQFMGIVLKFKNKIMIKLEHR